VSFPFPPGPQRLSRIPCEQSVGPARPRRAYLVVEEAKPIAAGVADPIEPIDQVISGPRLERLLLGNAGGEKAQRHVYRGNGGIAEELEGRFGKNEDDQVSAACAIQDHPEDRGEAESE